MRVVLLAALVVALIGVAGCGDDNGGSDTTAQTSATETSPTGTTTPGAKAVDVSLTDFKIDPADPRISKAGEVTFKVKNDGGTVHSLEVEGPKGETKLPKDLDPGQTETLKVDFSKAGKYEWYCPIDDHRGLGMEGEITVGGGGSGDDTSTTNTTETNTTEDSGGSGSY